MNQMIGSILALTFLFGLGLFNVARGVQTYRKRKSKKWLGILRSLLGIPLLIAPVLLYIFLKRMGQF